MTKIAKRLNFNDEMEKCSLIFAEMVFGEGCAGCERMRGGFSTSKEKGDLSNLTEGTTR